MSKVKKVEKTANKYQYLAGNIALFTVGNFVSKLLVFFLVPLYTNELTTSEYGVADLLQVTLLLLVPALTENIGEAALRFGIEESGKRGSILRTGLKAILRADIIVTAAGIVLIAIWRGDIGRYLFFFIVLFITDALYEFLILYFQGSEMVPAVVIGSIVSTAVMIVCNILFLLVFKIGLTGYILSQVTAYIFASAAMLIIGRMGGGISLDKEDSELKAQMYEYSRPMLFYSTGSWINNASDRYIVLAMLGTAVNGVYGVAYKIPAILMVFQRIFAQAWQMSATKSYADEKSGEFFSQMYRIYNSFMVMGCAVLILIVRPLASIIFRKDFYEAWMLVPPLLISVIFGALTGFLGSICLAYKDSKSMGIATMTGALLNVVLNIVSIPYIKAQGAAWATAISYGIMCLLAGMFVRKHVKLEHNVVKEIVSYMLLVAESIVMICDFGHAYILCAIITIAVIILYLGEARKIVAKFYELLRQRLKKH